MTKRYLSQSKCKHPLKNRQMGIVDGKLVLRCSKCKLRVPLPKSSYKKVTVNLEDWK